MLARLLLLPQLVLCTDCLQTQMRTKVWKNIAKPRKPPASRGDSNNDHSTTPAPATTTATLTSHKPPSERSPPDNSPPPVVRKRTRQKKSAASRPGSQGDYSVYIPVTPDESEHWQFAHVVAELAAVAMSNGSHKQVSYHVPAMGQKLPFTDNITVISLLGSF